MCRLTLPLTQGNLLGNFPVSGLATRDRGTPKTRIRMMLEREHRTGDIPEDGLIPSFAESEACESFIQI